MNNKTLMLAIVGCLTISQLAIASGRDTNVKTSTNCTGYVTGGCKTGDIGINAVGDKVDFNTAGVPVQNIGMIAANKRIAVKLPAAGKKIYAFTPTAGSPLLAGKQIKVLFVAFDLNRAFPLDTPGNVAQEGEEGKTRMPWANNMIKVYRQLPGETQWTEIAAHFTADTNLKNIRDLQVEVMPNGEVTAEDVGEGQIKANLGKIG